MNTPKEVEYGFFGCLLDFGGMSITVNLAAAMQEGANEAWFDEKRCRLAWAAVESLWKSGFNGENPNAVMILAEAQHIAAAPKSPHRGVVLDGTFLDEAAKYGRTREDIRAYAKELRNAAMARRTSARLMEAMDALGKESDSAHVVSSLVSDLNGIRQKESSVQELSMKDLTASVMKTFDTAHEQYVVKRNYDYVTGIPLLWRAVSRRMDGIQPGVTIVAASTVEKAIAEAVKEMTKSEQAKYVGSMLGQRAIEKGVATCVFDRSGYLYMGRLEALADGAREAGLQF